MTEIIFQDCCCKVIAQLKNYSKIISLQWIPGHCQISGNEKADFLAKKGTKIPLASTPQLSYQSVKLYVKSAIREWHSRELGSRISSKHWKNTIMCIPARPRMEAVAMFRLTTGHDLLAKHLHRIGILPSPNCKLCNLQEEMDRTHLKTCSRLQPTEIKIYWEARKMMAQNPTIYH